MAPLGKEGGFLIGQNWPEISNRLLRFCFIAYTVNKNKSVQQTLVQGEVKLNVKHIHACFVLILKYFICTL